MFKKTKLAAAILAAVATSAQAVNVNPSQTGEVLIYPYYNVNNNFQTNFSVTNTTNEAKIIKIRFRESGNSQDTLDFNVYMSPQDVWVATVRNVGGKANVFSTDTTCTVPANDATTSVGVLSTTGWNMNTVYPDVTDADAREGYIEVIEVGTIPAGLYADTDGDNVIDITKDSEILGNITHVNGTPTDCSVVTDGWTKGVGIAGGQAMFDHDPGAGVDLRPNWFNDAVGDTLSAGLETGLIHTIDIDNATGAPADTYLGPPSGGLYGDIIYLNNASGSAYVADPVAIDNYSLYVQHYLPNDVDNFLLPSLASGSILTSAVVNRALGTAALTPGWLPTADSTLNDGDANTPRSGTNPYPIAHVLMATSVMNDFFVDANFNGATDWVITFPMRKHGIYNGQFSKDCSGDLAVTAGVISAFSSKTEGTDTCFLNRDADVKISVISYDREETDDVVDPTIDVSPVIDPSTGLALQREVNILTVDSDADSVLGSANPTTVTFDAFDHGWARISFDGKYTTGAGNLLVSDALTVFAATTPDGVAEAADDTQPNVVSGVPVIGFAAIRGDSAVAAGSFGETIPHKTTVDPAGP